GRRPPRKEAGSFLAIYRKHSCAARFYRLALRHRQRSDLEATGPGQTGSGRSCKERLCGTTEIARLRSFYWKKTRVGTKRSARNRLGQQADPQSASPSG